MALERRNNRPFSGVVTDEVVWPVLLYTVSEPRPSKQLVRLIGPRHKSMKMREGHAGKRMENQQEWKGGREVVENRYDQNT